MPTLAPYGQSVINPRAAALEQQATRQAPILTGGGLLGRLGLYARARALQAQADQGAMAARGEFSARLQALSGAMSSGDPGQRSIARAQALELASTGIGSDDPLIRNFALQMLAKPIDELLDVPRPTTTAQPFGRDRTGVRAIADDGQGGITVQTVIPETPDPDRTTSQIMRAEEADPRLAGTPEGRRMVEVKKRGDGSIASIDFASQGVRVTNKIDTGPLGKTTIGKAQQAYEAALDAYGPAHPVTRALLAEIEAANAPAGEEEAAVNERKIQARRKALRQEAATEVQRLQSFLAGVGASGVVSPKARAQYESLADAAANAIAKARGTPGAEPGIPQLDAARASLPTLGDLTLGGMGGGDIFGAKIATLYDEFGVQQPAAAGGLEQLDADTRRAVEGALPPGARIKSVTIEP